VLRSGGSYFPRGQLLPAADWQTETLRRVGNPILDDSGQMWITVKESPYVSAGRSGRIENCTNDFSGFRDIDRCEPSALDVDRTPRQSESGLAGQRVNRLPDADGAGTGASTSVLSRKSTPRDALKNGVDPAGSEGSAQAAEEALIGRILSGHKELFMNLVRPHQRTVYATVFSLLANKEDAEDVAQDTLMKALARLHQFRKESTFGTWLIQIAINEVRMRNRKQWRVPMLSMTHNKDDEKSYVPKDFEDWREIPSTVLERAEIREALVKALGLLERHYREAFVLRDIHDLSISETSAVLGISPGAVKTRLRRARLMLRDILAPGLGQDGRLGWASKEVRKPWE
jgi:RNA polymerase sigma-70 factor (ECF subfamily)